jgi:hypothetical protein
LQRGQAAATGGVPHRQIAAAPEGRLPSERPEVHLLEGRNRNAAHGRAERPQVGRFRLFDRCGAAGSARGSGCLLQQIEQQNPQGGPGEHPLERDAAPILLEGHHVLEVVEGGGDRSGSMSFQYLAWLQRNAAVVTNPAWMERSR